MIAFRLDESLPTARTQAWKSEGAAHWSSEGFTSRQKKPPMESTSIKGASPSRWETASRAQRNSREEAQYATCTLCKASAAASWAPRSHALAA